MLVAYIRYVNEGQTTMAKAKKAAIAATMTSQVETITPEMAEALIGASGAVENRSVRGPAVTMLAGAIERGEWVLNGESIVIDEHGILLDGQHRLHAVVRAGVSIRTIVVRGVPREAMITLDIGRARTIGDNLTVRGVRNANQVGATARWLWTFEAGDFRGVQARLTNTQSLDMVEERPGLEDFVARHRGPSAFRRICPVGNMFTAFCFAIGQSGDLRARQKIEDFGERVVHGEQLMHGDPEMALRNRWIVLKEARGFLGGSRGAVLHLTYILRAWNARYSGRNITKLAMRRVEGMLMPKGWRGPRYTP